MSRWQKLGYVQDSDEDEELSQPRGRTGEDDVPVSDETLKCRKYASRSQEHSNRAEAGHWERRNSPSRGLTQLSDANADNDPRPGPLDTQATGTVTKSDEAGLPQNRQSHDDDLDELPVHASDATTRVGPWTPSAEDPHANGKGTYDIFDVPSSPLTSIASTPSPGSSPIVWPPSFADPGHEQDRQMLLFPNGGAISALSPGQDLSDGALQQDRRFRPRNPIQLHPYLLEHEKYRQSLRSRGLRPVALGRHDSSLPHDARDSVAPAQSDGFDGENPSSPALQSSQASIFSIHSSPAIQGPPFHSSNNGSDEDLPDLNVILQRSVSYREGRRHKRRKIVHDEPALENARNATGTSKHRIPKFKRPRGLSPPPLPTPEATSELRRTRTEYVEFDSESDADVNYNDQKRPPDPEQTPAFASQEGSVLARSKSAQNGDALTDATDLKVAQRRIKGVLPASWLRLDKQAGTIDAVQHVQKKHTNPSPSKSAGHRGVAKRIEHGRRVSLPLFEETSVEPYPVELSDDAKTTPLQSSLNPKQAKSNALIMLGRADDQVDGVEEYDWIDPMIAPVQRQRRSGVARKNQKRLTDMFPAGESSRIDGEARHASKNTLESSLSGEGTKQHNRGRRKNNLSIIDGDNDVLPDFVRLAARQVRKRASFGRHSPSKKILHLHASRDNAEANDVLHRWETGQIIPRSDSGARTSSWTSPPVLTERSANPQQPFIRSERRSTSKTETLKNDTTHASSAQKTYNYGKVPRLLQTKLSAISAKPDENPPSNRHDPVSVRNVRKIHKVGINANRPGQLEHVPAPDSRMNIRSTFQRNLFDLEDHFKQDKFAKLFEGNPLIERYLDEDLNQEGEQEEQQPAALHLERSSSKRHPIRRLQRKRRPQRKDIQSDHAAVIHIDDEEIECSNFSEPRLLEGLGSYTTPSTFDCNLRALPPYAYFHMTTFIGSGEFQAALSLGNRDLETPNGSCFLTINDCVHRWSSWTDDVSTQMGNMIHLAKRTVAREQTAIDDLDTPQSALDALSALLRSMISYFAKNLHFLDSIDRVTCVARCTEVFNSSFELLTASLSTVNSETEFTKQSAKTRFRCLSYLAVLSAQAIVLSHHKVIDHGKQSQIETLFNSLVEILIDWLLINGHSSLKTLLNNCQESDGPGACIQSDDVHAEGIVIVHHITRELGQNKSSFWTVVNRQLSNFLSPSLPNARELEEVWTRFFAVLPFLEIDTLGLVKPSLRAEASEGGWALVRPLLNHTFELYSVISGRSSSINSYVRAALSRCYNLIRKWRWHKCEPTLSCIFDFFAKNGLSLLQSEESRGPAVFLEILGKESIPSLDPSDRSFHVFLKLLYAGLFTMRNVYSSKKVRNIAWRYIPNHGRVHKKEDDLREEDLNSLRNHHDLLCVLYMASPPQFRINMSLIQNLVELESSHMEVSRVNVRSWSNLARFELSADADESAPTALGSWFHSILFQLRKQHQLARTEAEMVFNSATVASRAMITSHMMEATIASNQRQIEAVLSMALGTLSTVLSEACDVAAALAVFENSSIATIYEMFDSKLPRVNAVVINALTAHDVYFQHVEARQDGIKDLQTSEDSQEYGEWPSFEDDFEFNDPPGESSTTLADTESLQILLSNCFGAESFSDDAILAKVTDTWIGAIAYTVKTKQRTWSFYLEAHSPGSWAQLRDTEQTRKYFPYYLASLLEREPTSYRENEIFFITHWITSLVERESMLKHQHRFTNALLNVDRHHDWTRNLPFCQSLDGKYTISLSEIRERRLSTISSVLANVRQSVDLASANQWTSAAQLRQTSTTFIKEVMNAMKRNFQEMQLGTSTRGAYIDFVQKVVEFLQQHTSEHCPVDRFFTDSVAFPLPADDPTYVVGRLKNYSLRLPDPAAQKKLAVFVISTSERAAVDGHQSYFTDQLVKSLSDSHEGDDAHQSWLLRQFLIEAVFCSFVQFAFSSQCGWILAQPIINAVGHIIQQLLFGSNIADKNKTEAVMAMTTSLLHSSLLALESFLHAQEPMTRPELITTARMLFDTLTATLGSVDYWIRIGVAPQYLETMVDEIERFATHVLFLFGQAANLPDDTSSHHRLVTIPSTLENLSSFCARELSTALNRNWVRSGTDFYMHRGAARREVAVDLGTVEEEGAELVAALHKFMAVLDSMPSFRSSRESLTSGPLCDDVFI